MKSLDLVKKNAILKAQVDTEEKNRKAFYSKWGFYLDYKKFCIEEAATRGFNEEKLKQLISFHKNKTTFSDAYSCVKPSKSLPRTMSGFVGWRCDLKYSLENLAPESYAPKFIKFKEPPVHSIILG